MVRGSLGEMTAFVFLPLYGLGLWRLYTWEIARKDYWKSSVPLMLGLLGIWMSYVPLGFIFSGFVLLLAFALAPRTFRRKTFLILGGACMAVALLTPGITVPYAKAMLAGDLYADTAAGNSFADRGLACGLCVLYQRVTCSEK